MRKTPIVALVAAEVVSILGSRMTYLALPWFVLVTTGSPSKMALVLAAEIAPSAILGIPSGMAVERLGARTTMLTCDAARLPFADLVVRDVPRKDFAVDAELAHAAGDQLGVLGAEVEDQDARGVDVGLGVHVRSSAVHFYLKIFWAPPSGNHFRTHDSWALPW